MAGHLIQDDLTNRYGSAVSKVPDAGTGSAVSRALAVGLVIAASLLPAATLADANCRERSLAEMRSGQVTYPLAPRELGAIHEIGLPSIVVTVRSADGRDYRRTTWLTLHLPDLPAVDNAWARMPAVLAAIAEGLSGSPLESLCTIAAEQALTQRLQERVREVLGDDAAVLRIAVAGAARRD